MNIKKLRDHVTTSTLPRIEMEVVDIATLLDVAEAARFLSEEDPCSCPDHRRLRHAFARMEAL